MTSSRDIALLPVRGMDTATLLHVASLLLDKVGYPGAWSERTTELLDTRLEMVREAGLPVEKFFEPVFRLTLCGPSAHNADHGEVVGHLAEENGELLQWLIRRK